MSSDAKRTPVAQVLADFDSHGIYDLGHATALLRAAGYEGSVPAGLTHAEMVRAIEARGLGGSLAAPDYAGQRFVAGHVLAAHVALQLLGFSPGSDFHGRGRSWAADVQGVWEWEDRQATRKVAAG